MIWDWGSSHNINIPLTPLTRGPGETPGIDITESELAALIEDILSFETKVTVKIRGSTLEITASGATLKLLLKELKTEAKLDWDGTAEIKVSIADFTLTGKVSPDKVQVGVSYTLRPQRHNVTKLDETFKEDASAVEGIVEFIGNPEDIQGCKDLQELIDRLNDLISPEVEKITKAVEAFKKIKEPKRRGVGLKVGVSVTGPGPEVERLPSPPPQVIQFTLNFTF